MGVFVANGTTLAVNGRPERLNGARVSSGFFRALGVRPALGRLIDPQDDRESAPPVVVLSHPTWLRHFRGDPSMLGRTVSLDDRTVTVVGVLPRGFTFPFEVEDAEVWVSLTFDLVGFSERGAHMFKAVGRLERGASVGQAQAELRTIARRLAEQYPEAQAGRGVNLVPLFDQVVGDVRPALLMLLAAVGFVLLIACANVANLLVARGSSREKELAIRAALGAGRGRIVRQLLTENLVVALAGGAAGLLLTLWSVDALVALMPTDLPRLKDLRVDVTVLAFVGLLSLGTGLLFGVAPAVPTARADLQWTLRDGGRFEPGDRAGATAEDPCGRRSRAGPRPVDWRGSADAEPRPPARRRSRFRSGQCSCGHVLVAPCPLSGAGTTRAVPSRGAATRGSAARSPGGRNHTRPAVRAGRSEYLARHRRSSGASTG